MKKSNSLRVVLPTSSIRRSVVNRESPLAVMRVFMDNLREVSDLGIHSRPMSVIPVLLLRFSSVMFLGRSFTAESDKLDEERFK